MKKCIISGIVGLIALSAFAEKVVLDANGDGKVSKEEYVNFRQKVAQQKGIKVQTKEALEKVFDQTDRNKDGFLSDEERGVSK